ncbi:NAD-dependent dehydratase [Actinoplanes cyaneus]|uniref:NAD-dependent dehydratase n=1 Tax=Actinoplanes cyaneus TaxID=52696 RepID=A0A919IPQ8_9ACTN|nr:NAD(P)-dependent oxidoreductase [Actinoplanes cyaneus]MCW2140850.1 NAD dependent epimerase/dehydratase family protein [Actinoplanes cyaneus]GID69102.1 NAD-dependent dehydratase [Actinoplanes cyaneus]
MSFRRARLGNWIIMAVLLITGAGGAVGGMLRDRLGHHELRLTDLHPAEGIAALDVTDGDAVEKACQGVDAVVHLGGYADEAPFDDLLEVNVRGTERVLAAAQRAGVPRVVLASSNHAAGRHPRCDDLADDAMPWPDSYYGWSKTAIESLGRLCHDRYGLHVICLRIGACKPEPVESRDLSVWLSPDDLARLVEASLTATGFHLVWGVSANTRRWWSAAGGAAIGYHPRDDAERWAATVRESDERTQQTVGGRA